MRVKHAECLSETGIRVVPRNFEASPLSRRGVEFFCIIGKSFGIPYDIKSPPGGIALGRSGRWLPGQPAAGGESCAQDSFYFIEKYTFILPALTENITKKEKKNLMKEKLQAIKEEAIKQIQNSDALDKLNEVRVAFLGKKGELTAVLKGMKDVAAQERPMVGQMVNETRAAIESILEETKQKLEAKAREEQLKREVIDVTLPAKKSMRDTATPTPLHWKRWRESLLGWDTRLWRDRKWNMTSTTLRN